MLGGSICLLPMVHSYASSPSGDLLIGIGQVGATLLIAYGVEVSWFLKESKKRSGDRENWVGVVTGIGGCGMLGIAFALGLSESGGSLGWIEELAFSWTIVTIGSLGGLVALIPLVIHEWAHTVHTEYSDE